MDADLLRCLNLLCACHFSVPVIVLPVMVYSCPFYNVPSYMAISRLAITILIAEHGVGDFEFALAQHNLFNYCRVTIRTELLLPFLKPYGLSAPSLLTWFEKLG